MPFCSQASISSCSIGREASEMSVSPLQNSSKPSPVPGPSTVMLTSGFSSTNSSATSEEMGSTVEDPEMKMSPVSSEFPDPPPSPPPPQAAASDLRLISAVLHINLHLERVGDMAVNIAKIARDTAGLPANATIITELREMADVVRPMLRTAMDAFVRRDLRLAVSLPAMDDPVDRLNRNMYREVAACAGDADMLE